MLVAAEHVHAREGRQVRLAGHPGGQDELLGAQHHGLPVPLDVDRPLPGGLVVGGALGLGVRPVVELHDLRVRLEPVGDLVLRREHRPVVRELQVRQVVVPDRVVQAELLVPAAPLVAGPGALVDDDRGHAELAQPRGRAPMPACPPPTISTYGCSVTPSSCASCSRSSCQVVRSRLAPCSAPFGPARALRLLVALELVERGEQRPGAARRAAAGARVPGRPRSRSRSTPR